VANHPSALKRHRQSERRRLRNQAIRSRLRTVVKQVRQAIASRDTAAAEAHLRTAARVIDKAVTTGVLHRNNASRKISRLSCQVHGLRAS
jgi:small subunit ribosomal protein S20